MSLRCSFGLDSRKVCFKGQLTLGGLHLPSSSFMGRPLLFLFSLPNIPHPMQTNRRLCSNFFELPYWGVGRRRCEFGASIQPWPPSLRRVQMHYLGRLASNGRILCPHSKAKLYIFRVAFSLSCLLRALPPMRNVFSCILERPLHPFRWSRQKFWRRHRAEHRPTPFKLVFYCRVPFPVFPRHYSPRLFHHPFRPSFASTVT